MTLGNNRDSEMSEECRKVKEQKVIARYIAEQLSPAEAEAFERHYLDCGRCFQELELTHAAAVGLVGKQQTAGSELRIARTSRWKWSWTAAVLAGVAFAAVFYLQSTRAPVLLNRTGIPSLSRQPENAATHNLPDPSTLERMASLQAPPSPPSTIRSADSNAARLQYQNGMKAYADGKYKVAISLLSEAGRLSPGHSPTRFYLGICYLMTSQIDEARREFSMLNAPDNPYAEDSHWFMAQGYLKIKDAPHAREELNAVVSLNDTRSADARQLLLRLDSLGF